MTSKLTIFLVIMLLSSPLALGRRRGPRAPAPAPVVSKISEAPSYSAYAPAPESEPESDYGTPAPSPNDDDEDEKEEEEDEKEEEEEESLFGFAKATPGGFAKATPGSSTPGTVTIRLGSLVKPQASHEEDGPNFIDPSPEGDPIPFTPEFFAPRNSKGELLPPPKKG